MNQKGSCNCTPIRSLTLLKSELRYVPDRLLVFFVFKGTGQVTSFPKTSDLVSPPNYRFLGDKDSMYSITPVFLVTLGFTSPCRHQSKWSYMRGPLPTTIPDFLVVLGPLVSLIPILLRIPINVPCLSPALTSIKDLNFEPVSVLLEYQVNGLLSRHWFLHEERSSTSIQQVGIPDLRLFFGPWDRPSSYYWSSKGSHGVSPSIPSLHQDFPTSDCSGTQGVFPRPFTGIHERTLGHTSVGPKYF